MKKFLTLMLVNLPLAFAADATFMAPMNADYFLGDWSCSQAGKSNAITASFKKDLQDKWVSGDLSVDGKAVERCHLNIDSTRSSNTLVCMEVSKHWKHVTGTLGGTNQWVMKGARNLGKKSSTLTETLTFVSEKEFQADYSNGDPKLTCTRK